MVENYPKFLENIREKVYICIQKGITNTQNG